MTNVGSAIALAARFGPSLPFDRLVEEVNRLYHDFEASSYELRHPEVFGQLPTLWKAMVELSVSTSHPQTWRILDYGCGTGFEALQIVRLLPPGSVESITCIDQSPEMLRRCESSILSIVPHARFVLRPMDIPQERRGYNLLATNSLLHHLPEPDIVWRDLLPLLSTTAIWLAGHEPSRRFYMNPYCRLVYSRFRRSYRLRRLLAPNTYAQRLARRLGASLDPAKATAVAAFRSGLFARLPSRHAIESLVDLHVPHSSHDAAIGQGFDFEQFQRELASHWALVWLRTYSFMGPYLESALPSKWSSACRDLATRFPDDGANFCSVWRRNCL
jgi:SAM-dependent methyltransferase